MIAGADPSNPQSWNGYSYVTNNPLSMIDPTGMNECFLPSPPDSGHAGTGPNPPPTNETDCVNAHGTWVISNQTVTVHAPINYVAPVIMSPQWRSDAQPPNVSTSNSQTSTWWLQVRVFMSALGNNFKNEFKPNGCFANFADELVTGESSDASPPGAGPEDVIRTVGQAGAASYVVTQGLSYPLKSSIYRGFLGGTETAAGTATLIPLIYEEGKALGNEWNSLTSGTCQ